MPNVNGWEVVRGREVVKCGNVRKLMHTASLRTVSDEAVYTGRTPWAVCITSEQDGRTIQTISMMSDTPSRLTMDIRLATRKT
jgi:hypothetical protein